VPGEEKGHGDKRIREKQGKKKMKIDFGAVL
jgi:hypothetical protein